MRKKMKMRPRKKKTLKRKMVKRTMMVKTVRKKDRMMMMKIPLWKNKKSSTSQFSLVVTFKRTPTMKSTSMTLKRVNISKSI